MNAEKPIKSRNKDISDSWFLVSANQYKKVFISGIMGRKKTFGEKKERKLASVVDHRIEVPKKTTSHCATRRLLLFQFFYHFSDIAVDADRAVGDLFERDRFIFVDAGVGGFWILRGHIPERDLDDDGRIVPDAELEEQ